MPDEGLASSDWVAFMPVDGFAGSAASRLVGAAELPRSDDGALCWTVEPPVAPPWLIPVPCALAKPVPAISAAAATEIIKRLVIEFLLTCFPLPAPTTKGDARCSAISTVPLLLFCEWWMNRFASKIAK